ncbi:MAG: MBL fold metallo-hydrolase [Deltaproteobacteria bacterium]|nr:MBL fold metallo-hydrolase [Deltaproteobacteria bacterium]
MRVRFWGARGNLATPGAEFVRYGGNTPCVEVLADAGDHRLILDAGTGIIPAGRALMAETPLGRGAGEILLILSHPHIDHIQGFPFFAPIYVRGNVVRVRCAATEGRSTFDVLEEELSPNYSPLYSLDELHATFDIQDWDGQPMSSGPLTVSAFPVPHGRRESSGVLVREGATCLAYVPNVEYDDEAAMTRVADAVRGASMLVHDAMHVPADVPQRRGYGHSSYEEAVHVARRAGVRHLVLFHHDPDRDDAAVDEAVAAARALAQSLGLDMVICAAAEGSTLAL